MRAVVVNRTGDDFAAELAEVAEPILGIDQVKIAVRAVAVNFVDLLTIRGRYQFRPALPYIPGKGPAGEVIEVGAAVKGIQVGDRVIAMAEYGGFADRACATHAYRLPPTLPFAASAAMAVAHDTAWMALRDRARLQSGESVLVVGAAGAVGLAAVQLAKCMGAGLVLAAVSSHARYAEPKALGADHCVTLDSDDLREAVRERVLELTDGRGVDVVLDMLGGDAFDGAIRSLAWRGRMVVVGFAAGRIPTLRANYLLLKTIDVCGLQISDYRKRDPDLVGHCFDEIFAWYEQGRVTAPAHRAFPGLSQWRAALDAVADPAQKGRQVLVLE